MFYIIQICHMCYIKSHDCICNQEEILIMLTACTRKGRVLEKTFGNKMKNKSSVMVIKEGKW